MMRWAGALAALLWVGACERSPAPPPAGEAQLAADDRIAPLLMPGVREDHYDRDTSDVVPLLIEKLERGEREPLTRAIQDLGALGAGAIEPLRRAIETWFDSREMWGPLQSAFSAVALNADPAAGDLLLRGLAHPMSSVRTVVYRSLPRLHARPEYFDAILAPLWFEEGPVRADAIAALAAVDPQRAVDVFLGWIEERSYADPLPLARTVAAHASGAQVDRARALAESAPAALRPWLLAPAVAREDEGAGEEFAEWLVAGHPFLDTAVRALADAGATRALVSIGRSSLPSGTRAIALDALARRAHEDRAARDVLLATLDNGDHDLRRRALDALVAIGEPEAIGRTLGELDGTTAALAFAVERLRPAMSDDAELARRVLERLTERLGLESRLPLRERAQTLASLGRVPLAEAVDLLFASIERERADAVLDGLPLHRWAAMQAANGGPVVRARLAQRLAAEPDPVRRIDLLFGVAAERDELAKRVLFERAEDDRAPELERVWAASQIVRQVPAWEAAPRLKRVALRLSGEGRLPMQRLLWAWY